MVDIGERLMKLVPADGRWYRQGEVVRLITTPGDTPPDRVMPDPSGDYKVLTCVSGHVRKADMLFVDLRKFR